MDESATALVPPEHSPARRVLALVWYASAPLVALGLFARAELTRVPEPVFEIASGARDQAAAHALALTWEYGLIQLLALWALGGLLALVENWPAPQRVVQVALGVPIAWALYDAFTTLASDPEFPTRPAVWGSYLAAGLVAWIAALALTQLPGQRPLPRVSGWVRYLAPPLAGAGAALVWVLNYELLPRLYAPVHLSAGKVALFLGGLALLVLPRISRRIGARVLLVAALAAAAFAGSTAAQLRAGDLGNQEIVHRYTNARTSMGQGTIVFADEASRGQSEAGGEALMSRTQALKVFDARSGMPPLPRDFDLDGFNVLLITIEATRFDKTSFGDAELASTPNMKRFVRGGAKLFTRAYSPSSTTLQAMSSIMTMSYPSAVPLTLWRQPWSGQLRPSAVTVAEVMSEVGYDTWWVGHNHKAFFGRRIIGLDQGFGSVDLVDHKGGGKSAKRADTKIADKAIEKIDKAVHAQERFFGWVFLVSPHADYVTHDKSLPHETRLERYVQEVRNADKELGRVIDRLDELGVYENTVIILTADHGEQFKEHGGTKHSSGVYEELVHVPLMVRIPGLSGESYDRPTSLAHLFAWLFNTSPGPMGEVSLAAIQSTFAPVLEATEGGIVVELLGRGLSLTGLVYEDEKIIFDQLHEVAEVFDLKSDPGEQADINLRGSERPAALIAHVEAYNKLRERNEQTENDKKKTDWLPADQRELEAQSGGQRQPKWVALPDASNEPAAKKRTQVTDTQKAAPEVDEAAPAPDEANAEP